MPLKFTLRLTGTKQLRLERSQEGRFPRPFQRYNLIMVDVLIMALSLCPKDGNKDKTLHPHCELDNLPPYSPLPRRLYDATRVPLDTLALWRALMTL